MHGADDKRVITWLRRDDNNPRAMIFQRKLDLVVPSRLLMPFRHTINILSRRETANSPIQIASSSRAHSTVNILVRRKHLHLLPICLWRLAPLLGDKEGTRGVCRRISITKVIHLCRMSNSDLSNRRVASLVQLQTALHALCLFCFHSFAHIVLQVWHKATV